MADVETVRCPKCQSAIWNDVFSEKLAEGYRFRCSRCEFTVRISGCKACGAKAMELVHGVDPQGGHRPYFRFRCAQCGREVRFQSDVYGTEG